jgi:hypothetical protein
MTDSLHIGPMILPTLHIPFPPLKQRGQNQFQLPIEYKSYQKKLLSYPKTVLRQLAE